ncbi:Telomeric repeat-binding factor 2 [Desulfitobacterium dichloroeliminans LMG P-21439]|uniref:Telomeric repeat-binding factor 2 n=1 Tax=Desulfitobacterium dichloroeliminans (strain LMG P-21439 / DCA1) TaxID=871963 RepID=L0F5B8_DESDL|nr:DUF4352 domain-containing protein [Desulfitobacterium dichloroeliminans]AGA68387.1 Telomeric repeat-binding factor 2 [Desulfitobacterium dichloroeliminans LMG P-21439]
MKKVIVLFLSLALMLTLAACGGDGGSEASSESPVPAESGNTPSSEAGADENKYYGIGEAAEVEGLEITIDKLEIVDDMNILQKYAEGSVYVKVYATAKNISDEIQFAKDPLLYIVRDGEYDAELSNESRNRDVWNFETDGMYFEAAIDPGETNSGWTVFQLKSDEKEIIMKYNVMYETVKFKLPIA